MLSPPLLGFVRDQTGTYALCLLIAGPLLLAGAAATWRLKSARALAIAAAHLAPAE